MQRQNRILEDIHWDKQNDRLYLSSIGHWQLSDLKMKLASSQNTFLLCPSKTGKEILNMVLTLRERLERIREFFSAMKKICCKILHCVGYTSNCVLFGLATQALAVRCPLKAFKVWVERLIVLHAPIADKILLKNMCHCLQFSGRRSHTDL